MLDRFRANSLEVILEEYKKEFGEDKLQGFIDGLTYMLAESDALFTIRHGNRLFGATPSNVRTALQKMVESKTEVIKNYPIKSEAFTLDQ